MSHRRLQNVGQATGICYLLGAFCWILNASWSGWPSGHHILDAYLLGISAILGAALFHVGAMCQLWEALNSDSGLTSPRPVSVTPEPWLVDAKEGQPFLLRGDSGSTLRTASGGPSDYEVPQGEYLAASSFLTTMSTTCADATSTAGALGELAGHAQSSHTLSAAAGQDQTAPNPLSDQWGCRSSGAQELRSFQELHQQPAGGDVVLLDMPAGGSPRSVFSTELPAEASCISDPSARVIRRYPSHSGIRQEQCEDAGADKTPPRRTRSRSSPGGVVWSLPSFTRLCLGCGAAACLGCGKQPDWLWLGWRPHHWGFRAACVQVVGTTIFLTACVCGFPGVLPTNYSAGDWVLWDAFFWSPFLVGSCLFITSALLSIRDCQGCWLDPKPCLRVWWMHVANTLGSIGFWLCSFFGFFDHPAQKYQRWGMAFSCLWGSCCFAVAAYMQLQDVQH